MANPLLDALSYIVDSLDKPGRAIRGGLAGRADELAAFIPFSDTMGLTDPSRAVSGRDLLEQSGFATGNSTLDDVLGFGVETALDPTTLIGAGIGNRLGRAGGRALEKAAMARGPGYSTTAADLRKLILSADRGPKGELLDELPNMGKGLSHVNQLEDAAPAVFGEISPQSRFLGAGVEGAAFQSPGGRVVRVGLVPENAAGRPIADSILQADRAADYRLTGEAPRLPDIGYSPRDEAGEVARAGAVRAEWLPMAEQMGNKPYWLKGSGQPGLTRLGAVKKAAADEGLRFHDAHAGNVGTIGDRSYIIDPGAVLPEKSFAGGFQPVTRAGAPSALTRALLDLLGGRPAMRRALDAGLASPDYATSLGRAGAVAGGSLGRAGAVAGGSLGSF